MIMKLTCPTGMKATESMLVYRAMDQPIAGRTGRLRNRKPANNHSADG